MTEQGFKGLAVLRGGRQATSTSSRDGHRQTGFTTKHIFQFRCLVDDLVKSNTDEVHEHQVNDWSQPSHRCTHAETNNGLLANRCVDDTVLAKFGLQSEEGSEHSTKGTDIFASAENIWVGFHHLADGLIEGLSITKFAFVAHDFVPTVVLDVLDFVYTSTMIWSGVG